MTEHEFEDVVEALLGEASENPSIDFMRKYRIAPEKAKALIEDLAPLCQVGKNTLTGELCNGFYAEGKWVVKRPLDMNKIEEF